MKPSPAATRYTVDLMGVPYYIEYRLRSDRRIDNFSHILLSKRASISHLGHNEAGSLTGGKIFVYCRIEIFQCKWQSEEGCVKWLRYVPGYNR